VSDSFPIAGQAVLTPSNNKIELEVFGKLREAIVESGASQMRARGGCEKGDLEVT
jgi:hypothetical protein